MERPGRTKSGPEPSKSVPGPVPRGFRTASQRCPSAFGVSSAAKHDDGTIVGRFCIGARKLQCAFRISFYRVLLASHEVSSERVHAAKNVRILGMSASQIEPGSVRASQNRARAAQSERQNAKKTPEGKRFFYGGANDSSWNEKVRCGGAVGARECRSPRHLLG